MQDHSTKTDTQLVKLTLENSEYLTFLIKRYETKLMRYIQRFTNLNKECAEDILQEVFIKIYKNLSDFNQKLSFSSWAYRITHNETLNYIRKNKNNKTISLETNKDDTLNLIEILKSDVDIISDISKKELKKDVWKVLKKVPKKYKEILILKYLEDKNYTEISDILRIPMGTVATLINRGKKSFKQIAKQNNYL